MHRGLPGSVDLLMKQQSHSNAQPKPNDNHDTMCADWQGTRLAVIRSTCVGVSGSPTLWFPITSTCRETLEEKEVGGARGAA